jgi:vancomycin permeability regulator SanA
VSGGIDKEGFDEAESMSAYLVENGIPHSAIVKDN